MFLLNAFSLNMLGGNADIVVREITQVTAASLAATCTSAVGHSDTAAVFSNVLEGDVALVGQYSGPRPPWP